MSKPTIVFVPGSYVLLTFYERFFHGLTEAGYDIKGVHPPSVGTSSRQGRDGPAPSMYEDARAIAQEVEKHADLGRDVILMGHSYGGVPMSQSTKGLGKQERKGQGKLGGIIQLAFITCLVPRMGGSAATLLSSLPNNDRPAISMDVSSYLQDRHL